MFSKAIFLAIIYYKMITSCFTKITDYFCDVTSQSSKLSLSVVLVLYESKRFDIFFHWY